jgi:hypothetical protein
LPFSIVWIDFEKAYDSVWREGLLVKLFKSGIQGKMWKWIQNFLDERLIIRSISLPMILVKLIGRYDDGLL